MDKEFEQDIAQEEQTEDATEDSMEDQYLNNLGLAEAYGAPEPEEKMNPSTFLHKAAFSKDIDVVRSTFLHPEELGKPLFTTRFMMKMEDISKYYLDDICKNLGVPNKIAQYFRADIINTAESGMSNKGFIANLNVTRRTDATKRRARIPIQNSKGGKNETEQN